MSLKKGAHIGGVRTLSCIRDRCRIDEDTGCWIWGLMCSSKSESCPVVRFDGMARSVRRVVLQMVEKPVPDGYKVVRRGRCHEKCVNPAHLSALSGSEYIRWMMENTALNGAAHSAARTLALRQRKSVKVKSIERAEEIRVRVANGEDRGVLATEFGISRGHLSRVARGENWVSKGTRVPASVWGFAAGIAADARGKTGGRSA